MALSTKDLGTAATALRQYARRYPRGYGYWQWKPLAVLHALQLSRPGDIIVYLDGRSGIPQQTVPWIDELVANDNLHLCALQMSENPEYQWTTGDLFETFAFDINGPEARSGQFAGGLFGFRYTEAMVALLEEWRSVVINRSELCRDEPSITPNHPLFIENRYDQSAFSLTVKKHMRYGIQVRVLGSSDTSGIDAIIPQQKEHPLRIPLSPQLRKISKQMLRRS